MPEIVRCSKSDSMKCWSSRRTQTGQNELKKREFSHSHHTFTNLDTKWKQSLLRVSRNRNKKKRILISTRRQICNTFQLLGHFSYKEKGYTMPVYSKGHYQMECYFHLSYLMLSGAFIKQMRCFFAWWKLWASFHRFNYAYLQIQKKRKKNVLNRH